MKKTVEEPVRISGYGIGLLYRKKEVSTSTTVLQMQDEEGVWMDVPTVTFLNGEEVVEEPKDYADPAD